MCHHYLAARAVPERFVAEFSIRENQRRLFSELADGLPGGAWPLKAVPALRVDAAGELEAFAAEWGLLPAWWKPSGRQTKRSAFQRKTINARAETAATKPTFRDAWRRRRCLLPVAEFFERGHYFRLPEGGGDEAAPVAFAGLWERWPGDSEDVVTATLLTTEPSAEVRAVGHHRMPVLLTTPAARRDWLVGGDAVDGLIGPLPDGALLTRPKDG